MAVTHADVEINHKIGGLEGKKATVTILMSTILGLLTFVLSLLAETWRSQELWVPVDNYNKESATQETAVKCLYIHSGITPVACSAAALISLIIAISISYYFVCTKIFNPKPRTRAQQYSSWLHSTSPASSSFRLQAAFFLVLSCVCFIMGMSLLVIGIRVEAHHIGKWRKLHSDCLIARQGTFACGGLFSLASTCSCAIFYMACLQAQRIDEEEETRTSETRFEETGDIAIIMPQITSQTESAESASNFTEGELASIVTAKDAS